MPYSQFSGGSSSPRKKRESFNNYSKKPPRCYWYGKVGHIRRYCRTTERNIAHTKKVIEEEEGQKRCLEAESRAINALTFINLETEWIDYNIIREVEKEDIDKKQEEAEDVQIGDMVVSIEEIKEADPKIGDESLNVKDIEVDSKKKMAKNQDAIDDFIGESIKGDVVKVEVPGQLYVLSRSVLGSDQILKVDEKAKNLMNDGVESRAPVSDRETYNMIEELKIEPSGGSCYNTEASQKIYDQIIIKSIEYTNTDETSLCYVVALESVTSKIWNPGAPDFSIACVFRQ